MTSDMILLDGSIGEGGGQMLRTALALSAVTGRAFQMNRVRAGRAKPGLMRQHLSCVTAAQDLCDADVRGAALGSTSVSFAPRAVAHGDRRVDIGTAGSACLVLQTVLPPLLVAPGRSRITITGGTHNPMAPTADFLVRAFVPALARMGADVAVDVVRPGFFPAGGGKLVLTVEGGRPLQPLSCVERGAVTRIEARAYVDRLPRTIAERELAALAARFAGVETRVVELAGAGPGNAVVVDVVAAAQTEVFSALGEQKRSSEAVANALADEVDAFVAADVPVGEHLADQLLIPMALAGRGRFRTVAPTLHTKTNIEMVQRFLPVRFHVAPVDGDNVEISVARGASC